MKKQITIGLTTLGLVAGGFLTRTWAVNWPQSGFREWQTVFNPVETLLEPLPDNFWWSADVDLNNLAFKRGRAWTPVVMDAGSQGLPDPIVVVGRQNQLLFYRPNLPRGLTAGAADPQDGTTMTFGGTNGALEETGVLTTNPVVAESPASPANQPVDPATGQPTALTGPRLVFVTHGLGVQNTGLTTDDPAYVQAISVEATDSTLTVKALGKLKIQQPLTATTARETRITGMTFADIGDANNLLPMLFLTTADGQVVCVDTTKFKGTTSSDTIDPKTAIRWRWTNPGPRIVVPAGGGTPNFPPNASGFAPVPFNDGMNPAVGQVPLNGLPDLTSLSAGARRTNQLWQDQVRLRNREWLVFVADRNANAWAIEAFGQTKEEATNPGQQVQTLTGRATTRWTAKIPGGTLFPARLAVPPLFWNGNTPTTSSTGETTGANNGYDDMVIFAGVGSVTAFDAQGNFLQADRPVFWDTSQFVPGAPPSLAAGQTLSPVTRKLGEADGTTQKRWQFPEVSGTPPADGRFLVTVIRAMAGWTGARQFDNNGQDFANTAADDDRIFIRWNEKYVRPLDRAVNLPTEPAATESYVERLGALTPYPSIETVSPIDTDQPVTITFTRTTGGTATTYTLPSEYLSILKEFTDPTRTDQTLRSKRARIAILKPVGVDNQDNANALSTGDLIRVRYTSDAGAQRTEDVTYPSRRGRDVEPTVTGQTTPQSGDVVPISIGRNAVTIEEEGTASDNLDERVTRPATEQDYDPLASDVTRYALVPGMSVANDNIWFGSRYRGRVYVVEAASLLLRGELTNSALENPTGGGAKPGPDDDIPAAIDPIGIPAIADGWMYISYGNGFLSAFANAGGGGAGTDVEPPIGPFGREGSRRSAIPMPEIRLTDTNGNPVTDEDKLRFDWGQPIKLSVTFQNFQADSLSLQTNPIRVTIRGPMGDLPPVTVSPSRQTTNGAAAGVATPEIIIPNATPSNPMTPGTPLLKEVPDVSKRTGIAHWELRVEQIGTNWIRTDDSVGPWEPDRDAATWNPTKNTAPWFTLNNPIGLLYNPQNPTNTTGGKNIAYLPRFSTTDAAGRYFEGKNGDPYPPGQTAPVPDVKSPNVVTVGTDPNGGRQLLFAEHSKSSPAMVLGVVDRSDLGLRPTLGSLRVRVQLPKVTKLGFPLLPASDQATGIEYGSVDQNYPDDGPDGFYPSIPGERLNVVKQSDGSNAASGSVALRGVSTGSTDQNAPPTIGSDGYEVKILQPELFNISVDIPAHQPDGIYATRARLSDPSTSTSDHPAVPSPATKVDPRTPYRDFAPDDPNVDVNNPPVQVAMNDRPARVTVFVDANNNGRLDLQGNYREPYRTFAVQVVVKPDMRLEAAAVAPRTGSPSRLVDLGKLWHGFQTPTWRALQTGSIDAQGRAFFEQYWKPFVLLNTGNTNLVEVKPEVMLSAEGRPVGPVGLPSDGVDPYESLTLMRDPRTLATPPTGQNKIDANQIYLRTSFDDQLQLEQGNYDRGGVWLQKARPGSSSPGTGLYAGNPAAGANVTAYEPKLSLNVPMGTPLGTYSGDVRFFNDKKVSIVQADSFPLGFGYQVETGAFNRLLDRTADQATGQLAALEPAADPALTVKVRVTENVAAGSTGDANLRQQLGIQGGTLARTSPAAGLDIVTNRLFLFYASNQQGLKGSPAQPLRFDIFGAGIKFDGTLGSFPFDPVPLQGGTWTDLGQVSDQPVTTGVVVKNTKPFFAQDQRLDTVAAARAGYVFWHEEQAKGPGDTQARIMYRRVTPQVGETQVLAPGGSQFQEGNVRQSPRAAAVPVDNALRWFVFWNGSQQQKNNVFFSQSANPDDPTTWTPEALVPTSPSLATVQEASPSYVPSTGTLWLFYSGFNQKLGRSDVFATKLDPTKLGSRQVVENPDTREKVRSLYGLLGFAPRLGEILRANPTRTTFTAAGVDWQVSDQNPAAIFINGYVPLPGTGARPGEQPGQQKNGLQVYLNGQPVSELTYRGLAANDEQNWSFKAPLAGTGTATVYVSIDGASGTVRFSMPPGRLALTGVSTDREKFPDPQVVADYLPGSLRLTNSDLGATGGMGFTTSTYEPSWYWNTLENAKPLANRKNREQPIGARADRLWAIWRRSGNATTLGPTLFYKTFRPGIQLVHPLRGAAGSISISGIQPLAVNGQAVGAAPILQDVDVQDGVLYFRQEDEGRKIAVTFTAGGNTFTETHYIGWREEGGEAPVPMDVSVNEGTVTAFPMSEAQPFVDINQGNAVKALPHLSKIWLFWTSTRGAGSDIFHATVAPRLTPAPS